MIKSILVGIVVGPAVCCAGIFFLGSYTNSDMYYLLRIISVLIGALISIWQARGSRGFPLAEGFVGAMVSYGSYFGTPFVLYMMGLVYD
jgi:hypothetical protein